MKGFGGVAVSEAVGQFIDWVNDQHAGAALYDLMHPDINTNYRAARTVAPNLPVNDPLTLDLDADGIETTGINPATPILFDHAGTGVKTATGWLKPDDAFLVLDRNANGTIDSGKELFGDATPLATGGTASDGFAALAQEDTNLDGLVNAADAHFAVTGNPTAFFPLRAR